MCFWSKYPILGLLHLVHGAVPGIFSPEVTVDSCLPKWSGRTWKQAFCSDLFTVSALEQRFPLKEGLGYLKISCNGSLLWFIFRIAAAFCSVLHTTCLFLKECHRRSCFGVPACRPAPLPGAAELWEHGPLCSVWWHPVMLMRRLQGKGVSVLCCWEQKDQILKECKRAALRRKCCEWRL